MLPRLDQILHHLERSVSRCENASIITCLLRPYLLDTSPFWTMLSCDHSMARRATGVLEIICHQLRVDGSAIPSLGTRYNFSHVEVDQLDFHPKIPSGNVWIFVTQSDDHHRCEHRNRNIRRLLVG
jgi:hypothetical protein